MNPETLFRLSKLNASSELVFPLGNGADGEAIAYNPLNKLMYHWSGNSANIMESFDLESGVVTNIPQSGPTHYEILCATWDKANQRFIAVSNYNYEIFTVTTGGAYTLLGAPEVNFKGIAFANGNLYAAQSNGAYLYTLNPSNAAILNTIPVTAPGITGTISGFNGLATDPDDGVMWAILRVGSSGPQNPGTRYLGTITPAGVFTSVGALNDTFATIEIVGSGPITLDGAYQVRYASNLTLNDAIINFTNTGANGNSLFGPGYGGQTGNICVNVYAFSPDEQLVSCCSCLVTPNGLMHVTANNDLVSNTLTGIRPDSIVIKLVATSTGSTSAPLLGADTQTRIPTYDGSSCTNSAAQAGGDKFLISSGMLAWGTSSHSDWDPVHPDDLYVTETQFLPATLSRDELKSITNRCTNIIGNGSSFGICRSCRLGGLGGDKK